MIEQVSNAVKFLSFFTSTKQGASGLDVTVDIYDPTGTLIVNAGVASELGGGAYSYVLGSGATASEGEYLAIFKTASDTVDQQHIPALWVVGRAGVERLDAGIASVKAKTDNLPADPADASDIAGAFGTVNGTLTTIAGYIDTEVAAIKAKTDLIPTQPAAVGSAMTLAAGAITSGSFAADAITSAALAASAVTEIQSGLMLAAGYTAPDNAAITSISTELAKVPRVGFQTRWTNTDNGADFDEIAITAAT